MVEYAPLPGSSARVFCVKCAKMVDYQPCDVHPFYQSTPDRAEVINVIHCPCKAIIKIPGDQV